LNKKLKDKGFLTGRKQGIISPTSIKWLIKQPINSIIEYYKCVYVSLYTHVSIFNYRSVMHYLHHTLKLSLALTIGVKMKIKTKHKVFIRYGYIIKNTTFSLVGGLYTKVSTSFLEATVLH
jgi:hypothetical protein